MFINSQYDQWAISNILAIHCMVRGTSGYTPKNCPPDQLTAIQEYRTKYMKFVNENLSKKGWGMWTIACAQHVYLTTRVMYDSSL